MNSVGAKKKSNLCQCIFPHTSSSPSVIGIQEFSPSSVSADLTQLLGESKESLAKLISSSHPYLFNLGGGNLLPASDCDTVADLLLARNLPEVYNDTQTSTVFIPETFLPTIPLAVDTEDELASKLSDLSPEEKKKLGLDDCLKAQVAGDRLEERLYKALKAYPDKLGVVIQGGCMRTPGAKNRGEHSEHDFLIINPELMCVLVIECKRTLTGKAIYDSRKGCLSQLKRAKERLETFFGSKLLANWSFIGMVYYEEDLEPPRFICSVCEPFLIKSEKEVTQKLSALKDLLKVDHPTLQPSHEDYKKIVRTLLFLISAKPSPTPCLLENEVYKKIVGEKGFRGKKDKIGQGSLYSVIFWTSAQAEIMFNPDYQFVVFLGPWSVGKTLCMREKARQLASEDPGAVINYCNITPGGNTLLQISTEHLMSDLPNIRVLALASSSSNLIHDLKCKVRSSQGDWFVDEAILPGQADHKNFAGDLTDLVKEMKAHGRRLWMTVAGMDNPAKLDPEYLENFLFALKGRRGKGKKVAEMHLPDLEVPLRSCLSVLQEAGLGFGNKSKTLGVSSGYGGQTNVQYRIPANLIEGTPCLLLEVTQEEGRVEMARRAREEMRRRRGGRGVPIIFSGSLQCSTSKDDLKSLCDLLVGLGAPHPLCYISHPPSDPKKLGDGLSGVVFSDAAQAMEWLERREKDEEERDLLVEFELARGWEVDSAIVVVAKGNKTWENAVMRAVGHVVILKNF